MKRLNTFISSILVAIILIMNVPVVSSVEEESEQGINLKLILDADTVLKKDQKIASPIEDVADLLINSSDLGTDLSQYAESFLKSNPDNQLNLIVLFRDLENSEAGEYYASMPGVEGVNSRKYVFFNPDNIYASDFADCIDVLDKEIDPNLTSAVVSISPYGGMDHHFIYRFIEMNSINEFNKNILELSKVCNQSIARVRSSVHNLNDRYKFYSIYLFKDTKWDPMNQTKVDSYLPFKMSNDELNERINYHSHRINGYENLDEALYLLTNKYSYEMMVALGDGKTKIVDSNEGVEQSLDKILTSLESTESEKETKVESNPEITVKKLNIFERIIQFFKNLFSK